MRLAQWVKEQGYGEIARIAAVTGLRYGTVHKLATKPDRTARGSTAARISKATGGIVTVEELCVSAPLKRRIETRKTRPRRARKQVTRRARVRAPERKAAL